MSSISPPPPPPTGSTPPPPPQPQVPQPAVAYVAPKKEKKILSAKEKRKIKAWFYTSVGVALVALFAVFGFILMNSNTFGPKKQVEAYLDAVIAGDADAAAEIYTPNVKTERRAFLTSEVYKAAKIRPTSYRIEDVETKGSKSKIKASLKLDGKDYSIEFELKTDTKKHFVFNEWRVVQAPEQNIYVATTLPELSVNGKTVKVVSSEVDSEYADTYSTEELALLYEKYEYPVLPGVYEFTAPAPGKYVKYGEDTSLEVLPGVSSRELTIGFSPVYTQAVVDDATAQVLASLESCTQPTVLIVEGCEIVSWNPDEYSYATISNITRSWVSGPTVDILAQFSESAGYSDYRDYGISMDTISAETQLVAVISEGTIQYTYDGRYESYDYEFENRSQKLQPFVEDVDSWNNEPLAFPITIEGDTLTVDVSAIRQTHPEWITQ